MKQKRIYHRWTAWALSAAMLLGIAGTAGAGGLVLAAGPDEVLFSSSFEEGDGLELLENTAGGRPGSQVDATYAYGIRGSVVGLIDPASIQGNGGNGDEGMGKLFDGSVDTKSLWVMENEPDAQKPAWISFRLTEERVIRNYGFSAGNDAPERDPAAWSLYGSADGADWKPLDSREGAGFYSRGQENLYTFDNETPYAFYKLEITGNGGSNMTQLSEWKLGTGEGEMDVTEPPRVEGNITGLIVKSSVDGTPEEAGKENENKQNLFDGKTGTKFLARVKPSPNNPVWVSFRLKEARTVRTYSLSAANDNPDRDPRNWSFCGSADGENWTVLDARIGVDFAARYQEKVFSFSNETPYLYYKLVITANNGSPNTTQWSEIKIGTGDGSEPPDPPDPPAEDGDVTGLILPESIQSAEGEQSGQVVSNLFDGDFSTKWLLSAGPTAAAPIWVSFRLSEEKALRSYFLTAAAEKDITLYDREPSSWSFEGSADGEHWTVLDTRVRQHFTGRAAGENETKAYAFQNDTAYAYYKLNITKNTGSPNRTQLAELAVSTEAGQIDPPDEWDVTELVEPSSLRGSTEIQQASNPLRNLFDGSPATKWLVTAQPSVDSPVWTSFRLEKPRTVTAYALFAGGDQPTRDPKEWTLQGSYDGENWAVLDTEENQSFSRRYGERRYAVADPAAYSYYKLAVTGNNGASNRTQIADLVLYSSLEKEPEAEAEEDYTPLILPSSITGASAQDTNPLENLFDGSADSKCVFPITPSAADPVYARFALSEPKAVNRYTVTPAVCASGEYNRDPKDWKTGPSRARRTGNTGTYWTPRLARSFPAGRKSCLCPGFTILTTIRPIPIINSTSRPTTARPTTVPNLPSFRSAGAAGRRPSRRT